MSKSRYLEKLLDGAEVEWVPLSEVVELRRGKRLVKSQLEYSGNYPVFQNSMKPLGFYNEGNAKSDTVFIISAGAAGEIGYSKIDFWAADDVYICLTISMISSKFLYHCLLNQQGKILGQVRRASIPRLSKLVIERLLIPIPCPDNPQKSLAIQKEIARILDAFTALTTELTTELSLRKKQYQYYRDLLLKFDENEVEWRALTSLTLATESIRWKETHKSYRYIDLTSVSRESHSIVETSKITANNAPSRAQKLVKEGDVIFATTRPTQLRLCLIDKKYSDEVASTGYCVLRANGVSVLPKWIYYHLSSQRFFNYVEEYQSGSAYPAISDSKVKEFELPIPYPNNPDKSLAEQARIVAILDKFDTLTNSITTGLPREIELRQRQYEYYRDLLLSFD